MRTKKFPFLFLFLILLGYSIINVYCSDLTFGKTDIGGSQENQANPSTWGCKFTMPETGTITKIVMYLYGDPCNARAYIFSDNEGLCNLLLATSNEISISSAWAWRNFTISYEGTGSTPYWLFLMTDANVYVKYDAGDTNQAIWGVGGTYPNPPSPPPSGWPTTYSNWILSFYAVYTVEEGGEEHEYVLTETLAFQDSVVYGKETFHPGIESFGTEETLIIHQEKRFLPYETALTSDTIVFGKEVLNLNVEYFIQETINFSSYLYEIYETIIEEIDLATVAFALAALAFVLVIFALAFIAIKK